MLEKKQGVLKEVQHRFCTTTKSHHKSVIASLIFNIVYVNRENQNTFFSLTSAINLIKIISNTK